MTVEAAPPTASVELEPEYPEDRVHTGLFWLAVLSLIVGILGIAGSRAWAAHAQTLIIFSNYNQTMDLRGQVAYHADPTTLLALPSASTAQFGDRYLVQTTGSIDQRAELLSSDTISVGSGHTVLVAQYSVDVTNLSNLKRASAWSYDPSNVADRSGAYSVNLPFEMGSSPQRVWVNQLDSAVVFTSSGQEVVDGVSVTRLRGHVDNAPVDPRYITALARAGVPAGANLDQLLPTLRSLGLNVDHNLVRALQLSMTGEEIAELAQPVRLDYTMSGDLSMLVEPRAGSIVTTEVPDSTYSARFDPVNLQSLEALLSNHRRIASVPEVMAALQRLESAPPITVFDLTYRQTPDSLQRMSQYAGAQRDWINRMTRVIPTTMLAVGIALLGVALLAGLTAWRRRDEVRGEWD